MNDPIVDEVRRIRNMHAQSFNYDLKAICEDIRRRQAECGHTVVTLRGNMDESQLGASPGGTQALALNMASQVI